MKLRNPNLSNRVDSEDCANCGHCCEIFEIWYPPSDGTVNMEIIRSEIQRLQMLSGIGDKITTRDNSDGSTWVIFNVPCRYLNEDKMCAIYNSPDRPWLCRYFPYPKSTVKDCPKLVENSNVRE
ncbi:MAG: YkgJ family cysteine cluster protein [Bacilli bacterium]